MRIELCRIMDSDQVPEGTLTRMVGVHPVCWRDATLGAIPEPTLVAVEDEKAEAAVRLAELVERLPLDWTLGTEYLSPIVTTPHWFVRDLDGKVRGHAATPLLALEAALGKEE